MNMKVAQSCPTLWHSMDCTVFGILQARIIEWVSGPFSRVSSHPKYQTQVSYIAGGFFYHLSHNWSHSLTISQSVSQFSRSVLSDSLQPHESQHARPPCPAQIPEVNLNSCPLSGWCQTAISSSVIPFSSCPQSLWASGSFPMSQLFTWVGQSIGVSASVFPMNTQD